MTFLPRRVRSCGVEAGRRSDSMHVGFQSFASSSPLQSLQNKGKNLPAPLLFVKLEKVVSNQRRQRRNIRIRKVAVLARRFAASFVAPVSLSPTNTCRRFFDPRPLTGARSCLSGADSRPKSAHLCAEVYAAATLRRCPRSAANPASILSRPYPIRNRSVGVAPNSDRYTLAGSSNTPLSSTSRRANSSTPSRPIYRGYPMHPPSGKYHSNKSSNSAKNFSNIGKFLAISARFRARIRSRAFNAICASNSLGAAPQIDV